MARRPAPPSVAGGKHYMEVKDSLSLLDVVDGKQFERKSIDQKTVEYTEEKFYRGAPPNWLNFHISEQAESGGSGTSIIKRDGYKSLKQQIYKRKKGPGTSVIKLFHQSGCGGTTLAMQVLWDLRKTFRCAVLTGSTSDLTKVAKQVVELFTAESQGYHKTVLLLLEDEIILESLQDSIMEQIAQQEIDIDIPVVILLNCVRASDHVILKKEHAYKVKQKIRGAKQEHIILKKILSDSEKQQFNDKKEELLRRFGENTCQQFHGFNIMQTNFSDDYIQKACEIFRTTKKSKRPLKNQLFAFLSLLNAYVPGSYLLESQCLKFLRQEDSIYRNDTLAEEMKPFNDFIVTFQEDKVRMVHPMIAQCCTELMAEAGVTRSDTAINFLTSFCEDEVPPFLLSFIKDMLTKREPKKEEVDNPQKPRKKEEKKEKFSRYILDIKDNEDKKQCATVLKVASTKFVQNSFFPQALARFYYGELQDYDKAEKWAREAKERDPKKSFIADTLGQVYKSHLKSKDQSAKPREFLQLAKKAIDAFEDEERLAADEHDIKDDGKPKVLWALNTRGKFGYLEVCNIVYDLLVKHDCIWKEILTKNVSLGSVLESLGDNKLFKFNDLLNSLRDNVEKHFEFFDIFITYSVSAMKKDKALYVSREAADCYKKYVGDLSPKHNDTLKQTTHKLKQKLAVTAAGVLSCLDRRCTASDIKDIATCWEEICHLKDSSKHALANYILANIMLINMKQTPSSSDYQNAFRQVKKHLGSERQPEFDLLALLVCWPREDDEDKIDLSQFIHNLQHSYEHEYKKLFQSRYLRPLFFIGTSRGLDRFVHRRVLEVLWMQDVLQDSNTNWRNENIFKDPIVQERLLKVEGVVRNYRLYATLGGTEIEIKANRKNSLWRSCPVSFYLGFTIQGPVAYRIQEKIIAEESSEKSDLAVSGVTGSSDWTKLTPEVKIVHGDETYSFQSERGFFECSVSGLRWVCKEQISFRYQFCSWEEHTLRPACMDYMPAGPLLDISVTSGEFEEVHLPHWIDCDPPIPDMFTVLHVGTCGDSMEQVSEMTSSHVKLFQPTFSPNGVMILEKLGLRVKVNYDALIFKTQKEFLTLHVYLVPPDQNLKQTLEKREASYGSTIIPKPNPDKSLKMLEYFSLTTDTQDTTQPEKLKLSCERTNFFEVFIRNADIDFTLKLEKEKRTGEDNVVWTCIVRTGDYKNSPTDDVHGSNKHFVDLHRIALIDRVKETPLILDKLLHRELISHETYDYIRTLTKKQDQMREILTCVCASGETGKDVFYEVLKQMKHLKSLLSELEKSQQRGKTYKKSK